MDIKQELLQKNVKWAVVGASNNLDKYGHKIYKKLRERGYTVYPVNPNYEEVMGDKCYKDLNSLPEKVDAINMVVPSNVGIGIIEEAKALGIQNIWLQPGSESREIITFSNENNLDSIQSCILVELKYMH